MPHGCARGGAHCTQNASPYSLNMATARTPLHVHLRGSPTCLEECASPEHGVLTRDWASKNLQILATAEAFADGGGSGGEPGAPGSRLGPGQGARRPSRACFMYPICTHVPYTHAWHLPDTLLHVWLADIADAVWHSGIVQHRCHANCHQGVDTKQTRDGTRRDASFITAGSGVAQIVWPWITWCHLSILSVSLPLLLYRHSV